MSQRTLRAIDTTSDGSTLLPSASVGVTVADRRPDVVLTDASSSFECEYTSGINRVLSFDAYLLIDNIARNFEVWQFDQGDAETPARRSVYDVTTYPNDPIASLLDVDMHAAFLREAGQIVVVNHYGRARWFDLPAATRQLRPVRERQLLGDMERIVIAHDCFIASSPRGEYTDDTAQPGVFLFEPVTRVQDGNRGSGDDRLAHTQVLADWEVISALSVSPDGAWLAVASGPRLGVFSLSANAAGLQLGAANWEAEVGYHCQWLHFDSAGHLWTGGYRVLPSDSDGGDWDACRGGGATAFDVGGARVLETDLPDETAWGYGADPLVLSRDACRIFAVGRDGSLHVTASSKREPPICLYPGIDAHMDGEAPSMGIGHAALRGGRLYAGFSRGGYRLLRYDVRDVGGLS